MSWFQAPEMNAVEDQALAEAQVVQENPPDRPDFEKLIKHCIDLYELFKKSKYREKVKKEIVESRRVYEQISQKTDFPWPDASNMVLPLYAITLDNLEPRIVAALLGRDPLVTFQPPEMTQKNDMVRMYEDWWQHELKNTVGIYEFGRRMVHKLLLEGVVFAIPSYTIEEATRSDFLYDANGNVVAENGIPRIIDITEPVFEGGQIELVPFEKLYYPDNIGTLKEWNECDKIREMEMTYAELWQLKDESDAGWMDIGPWLLSHVQKTGNHATGESEGINEEIYGTEITGKEVIDLIECHITYPIYQDQYEPDEGKQRDFREERILVTIATQSRKVVRYVLQRDIHFPNKSLIKRIRLFPEDGLSCGKPLLSKMKAIQEGASDIFNLLVNIAYVVAVPWFFYEDKTGMSGEKRIYPGAGIKVDSVKGLEFPKFQFSPAELIPVIQTLFTLWERAGNIADLQIGRLSQKGNTATEVLQTLQEGNIKFNYQATTIKDEFIELLQALYDHYYQHMPMDKTFYWAGKPVMLSRKTMKAGWQFALSGSTEQANKLIERKENEDLYGLLRADPLANGPEILKDLLKSYGRTELERYINPAVNMILAALHEAPEVVQVVQKYMQTKAETQQLVEGVGAEGGTA